VRYLDSRIALLIANRMALDEVCCRLSHVGYKILAVLFTKFLRPAPSRPPLDATNQQNEVASHLEEHDAQGDEHYPDHRKMQQYGNLFFLLQSEPRHVASLCRLVNLAEIDTLLQTVMFTLYGNQYESREEHLLLTMFQVCFFTACVIFLNSSLVPNFCFDFFLIPYRMFLPHSLRQLQNLHHFFEQIPQFLE
jgi:hypothetical protein